MRILGIDPGLNTTGYGVIEVVGGRLHYQASGAIRIPRGPLPERLGTLFASVAEVARQARADVAAIEIVFVNVNPQSTLLLGQARGAAIAALASSGLDVAEYSALQLKKAVVGYGRASKAQMQDMVTRLLALPGQPGPDAADALGLAICHANLGGAFGAAVPRPGAAASPGAHNASTGGPTGSRLDAAGLRGMRVRGGRLVD